MRSLVYLSFISILVLTGCAAELQAPVTPHPIATTTPQIVKAIPTSTAIYVQPTRTVHELSDYGPDLNNLQPEINPLTGLQVEVPSNLDLPAVLVSISNSPITARPQAGLSFAANVYELFIGEGTTRFLSVFYGDFPRRTKKLDGSCKLDSSMRKYYKNSLGDRVWLDENKNGIQDPWEVGIGGICVILQKASDGSVVAQASTDDNGYYAFDASTLKTNDLYSLHFNYPKEYSISNSSFGEKIPTNDQRYVSSSINFIYYGNTISELDLGLLLENGSYPIASSDIAPTRTYVGPIRSGRLTYGDLNQLFPSSCLIFASAGEGILERLKPCEIVYGKETTSPNTALEDVMHLIELAKNNRVDTIPINYSGNLFSQNPPLNGEPADSVLVYFHQFAQSRWDYDPISRTYRRFTDNIDGSGKLHADTDRLTGRQLEFENVIILQADYSVFRHGQYDVDLCCGFEGWAFVFRDGEKYKVRWNTNNREWEQKSGLLRPIKFIGDDKKPFPLRPGKSWISIMTKNSTLQQSSPDNWVAEFAMPDDIAPSE